MAVIIDDFEVVVEPTTPQTTGDADEPAQAQSDQAPSPGPTPGDIQRIVRHHQLRDLRVRAH